MRMIARATLKSNSSRKPKTGHVAQSAQYRPRLKCAYSFAGLLSSQLLSLSYEETHNKENLATSRYTAER